MDKNSMSTAGGTMPLPNLKKVVKTRKGLAAVMVGGILFIVHAVNALGWFETVATIRPLLNQAAVVSGYGAAIGVWIGAHFVSIVVATICIGLFTWAARDVAAQDREEPSANVILLFTTLRQVAIGDPPYNWENATLRSEGIQVGLVARFANLAKSIPVGIAHNVRADVTFEDTNGNRVASHPAPWLYRSSPNVSFDVGAQNELLVALDVVDPPQFPPASMAQGPRPQAVLRTVEDVADREPNAQARYSFHRGISGSAKATIRLTVNGLAAPPYKLMLQPSDRSVTPQTPPTIRMIDKPTRWQRILSLIPNIR